MTWAHHNHRERRWLSSLKSYPASLPQVFVLLPLTPVLIIRLTHMLSWACWSDLFGQLIFQYIKLCICMANRDFLSSIEECISYTNVSLCVYVHIYIYIYMGSGPLLESIQSKLGNKYTALSAAS